LGALKLYGMRAAFDEIIAAAVRCQHEPQRIVGDLLTAEVSETALHQMPEHHRQLPLAKDIEGLLHLPRPTGTTR
jgi:hypothetical protein